MREAASQRLALEQLHNRNAQALFVPEIMNREDVGMGEHGDGLGLAFESPHRFVVIGQARGQNLDGHFAVETRVQCVINLAHPARPQRRKKTVAAQRHSRHAPDFVFDNGVGRDFGFNGFKNGFNAAFRSLVRGEERLQIMAQLFITGAGINKECGPFARRAFEGGMKHLFNLPPAFRRHLPISRCSQALARVHSRATVPGETLSASAVSSTLNPPKKRSSTIWPLLGSNSASAVSASSSATISAARSVETSVASSSLTFFPLPPRLALWRARA